ncbi:MAG: GHKL domain-containing protein [Lutibacter sp.]|uniref:sensor histidine kinase n=1 Tax=Lutibacter sp. TaxID=1925666 RepID=UPI001844A212|nr:ATP-binding protein [Lutibacter sp.]MBT8317468.1 GHKL domain-containing protein [Lutibacter sp.]NNJ58327.1 GHKL domain-containing protein [Lutibacter sp.]
MKIKQLSLRIRIFLSMILLIILASVLIAAVTIYQYKEQTDEYNKGRLDRKEESVTATINYWLNSPQNTYEIIEENLAAIFKDKIYEISDIENLKINIYDLKGRMAKSSQSGFVKSDVPTQLSDAILKSISQNFEHRFTNTTIIDGNTFQSSFTYITDNKFKPIGIINLQYLQDNSAQDKDLIEFLYRLLMVYALMFALAILLAYFISSYITRSIKAITDKMRRTSLTGRNEKIILKEASTEIFTLVNAYNAMIDELEESAVKLAKGEREQAWREMAKQVAHEIKNPLTPMRLTVQSFQRKFDENDPKIKEKINEFSKTLIQQIDTMSSIASAFSNFAKMPTQKCEELNVVEVVKHALDIFSEDYILFFPKQDEIISELDKTQLIRIITNLVKNAAHALDEVENKKIEVSVEQNNGNVVIKVADNGKGISEEDKERVFEPKFTTKSSGMGLGLPMVKNIVEAYNGTITFTSQLNKGTVFKIVLPKK